MSYTPSPQPPTSNQYPYGTYFVPGPYATQAGAYAATYPPGTPYPTTGTTAYGTGTAAYGANAYQAGVTGYGWPYPYGYPMPQPPARQAGTPTPTATPAAGQTQAQASGSAQNATAQSSTPATSNSTTMTMHPTTSTSTLASAPTTNTMAGSVNRTNTGTFSTFSPYARDTYATTSSSAGTGGGRNARRGASYKGLFTKELKNLMYGFGDDRNPASDTVNVMEEILVEFILDVCTQASQHSSSNRKARLSIEDLRHVLSRPADAKKLARMEELLFMQEDIKRARAEFDDNEMQGGGKAF
ncbi:hypothetical protein CCMSSC00406_0006839 [Pleurotus cornucopiae]|uniref:Uncharacterized protein n=1 Tax=Pleurotus cornucopiae TaxID=5321 RepID=A0ACB7J226_PLECO|nr:hypothetical protein CCMSSC00406_0006839 [Pleurotus cornucopiae]